MTRCAAADCRRGVRARDGARLGFRLFDLEDDLAALFGRPVDLIARKAINKCIREQVLADAQPLYAA